MKIFEELMQIWASKDASKARIVEKSPWLLFLEVDYVLFFFSCQEMHFTWLWYDI
jgi:hypothetical protein